MPFRAIFFTGLFTLAAVPASALSLCVAPASDEIKWEAVQWAGPQRDCSTSSMNVRWRITETAERIIMHEDSRSSGSGLRLNASHLNPDGSGRIDITYKGGKPIRFEFVAGHGPRVVRYTYGYHACVWELRPA
jgi:hypothetical protein